MKRWWRPRAGALVLVTVVAIGAVPVARDLLRSTSQEVSVEAYDRTDDPRVIVVHVATHPDFVLSEVATDEDAETVVLHLSVRPPTWSWSGADIAAERRFRVRLDRPLADRQVLDGRLGEPVPER